MSDLDSPNPAPEAPETPASDPLLDALSDTEDTSPEPAKVEEPVVDETPEEPVEPEAEAEPEAEIQPEANEDLQPELDPKEEARLRYEERQRFRNEQRAAIQAQTQQYVAEGEDEYEQRMRSVEAREYARTVEQTQDKLIGEFERAKANPDLQIFNPENKESFNQRAYDKAMKDFNSGYIEYDVNGNMIGLKGSLYEHLTETAELLNASVKSGAVQQVRATKNMRNKADTKPAAQPKEPQKDEIMEILKSE